MRVDAIYNQYFSALLLRLNGAVRDTETASDCLQEAFTRALMRRRTVEAMDVDHARAWLYTTARNIWIDKQRRTKYESTEPVPVDISQLDEHEDLRICEMLRILTPEAHELVELRHIYGYTSPEIGDLLHIPAATVRTRLRAAMTILKRALEEKEDEHAL